MTDSATKPKEKKLSIKIQQFIHKSKKETIIKKTLQKQSKKQLTKKIKHQKTPSKKKFVQKKVSKHSPKKKKKTIPKKLIKKQNQIPKPKKIEHKHSTPLPVVPQQSQTKLQKPIVLPKISYKEIYIKNNIAIIQQLIKENIYYPRKARRQHIQGEVILEVQITKKGKIKKMKVLHSPSSTLSYAAKQVMIMIEDQLPKPKQEINLRIPFVYKLH